MHTRIPRFGRASAIAALIFLLSIANPVTSMAQANTSTAQKNKAIVQAAFDDWKNGRGSVFDLLADDAEWTIAGASLAAGTYADKEAFMAKVIRPFNARVSAPLSPTIREIHADDETDTVVVLFDGRTVATDGVPYANTYAWFLQLREGRIVKATAFFDTALFDALWNRVEPGDATAP